MRWLLGTLVLCASWGLTETVWAECKVFETAPTYTAGQLKDITCDTHGVIGVGGGAGSATAAAPTLAEGSAGYFSFDLASNARFTLGTYISGEDPDATGASTNGVMVTEHRYLSSGQKTADAQIKASAGYVSHMICQGSDAAAVAGTIILHDATTETGTEVFKFTVAALDYHTPVIFPILTAFATGIYLGYTTTTDVACTVFSR